MSDLSKMETLLEALVINAEDLLGASKGSASPDEIATLQVKQDEILNEVLELDEEIPQKDKKGAPWKRIQKLMDSFEELNMRFIENLGVRKGLIELELSEVRQSKRQVKELKGSYAKKAPSRKSRINTIS